jgi:hypothetical protein
LFQEKARFKLRSRRESIFGPTILIWFIMGSNGGKGNQPMIPYPTMWEINDPPQKSAHLVVESFELFKS